MQRHCEESGLLNGEDHGEANVQSPPRCKLGKLTAITILVMAVLLFAMKEFFPPGGVRVYRHEPVISMEEANGLQQDEDAISPPDVPDEILHNPDGGTDPKNLTGCERTIARILEQGMGLVPEFAEVFENLNESLVDFWARGIQPTEWIKEKAMCEPREINTAMYIDVQHVRRYRSVVSSSWTPRTQRTMTTCSNVTNPCQRVTSRAIAKILSWVSGDADPEQEESIANEIQETVSKDEALLIEFSTILLEFGRAENFNITIRIADELLRGGAYPGPLSTVFRVLAPEMTQWEFGFQLSRLLLELFASIPEPGHLDTLSTLVAQRMENAGCWAKDVGQSVWDKCKAILPSNAWQQARQVTSSLADFPELPKCRATRMCTLLGTSTMSQLASLLPTSSRACAITASLPQFVQHFATGAADGEIQHWADLEKLASQQCSDSASTANTAGPTVRLFPPPMPPGSYARTRDHIFRCQSTGVEWDPRTMKGYENIMKGAPQVGTANHGRRLDEVYMTHTWLWCAPGTCTFTSPGGTGAKLVYQSDMNLVLYSSSGEVKYALNNDGGWWIGSPEYNVCLIAWLNNYYYDGYYWYTVPSYSLLFIAIDCNQMENWADPLYWYWWLEVRDGWFSDRGAAWFVTDSCGLRTCQDTECTTMSAVLSIGTGLCLDEPRSYMEPGGYYQAQNSPTWVSADKKTRLTFDRTGNLGLTREGSSTVYWSSQTQGHPGAVLTLTGTSLTISDGGQTLFTLTLPSAGYLFVLNNCVLLVCDNALCTNEMRMKYLNNAGTEITCPVNDPQLALGYNWKAGTAVTFGFSQFSVWDSALFFTWWTEGSSTKELWSVSKPLNYAEHPEDGPLANLVLQTDSNLVFYDGSGTPLWSSGTEGKGIAYAAISERCQFQLFDVFGKVVWSQPSSPSCTQSPDPSLSTSIRYRASENWNWVSTSRVFRMIFQTDGNLVIYRASDRTKQVGYGVQQEVVYASATTGCKPNAQCVLDLGAWNAVTVQSTVWGSSSVQIYSKNLLSHTPSIPSNCYHRSGWLGEDGALHLVCGQDSIYATVGKADVSAQPCFTPVMKFAVDVAEVVKFVLTGTTFQGGARKQMEASLLTVLATMHINTMKAFGIRALGGVQVSSLEEKVGAGHKDGEFVPIVMNLVKNLWDILLAGLFEFVKKMTPWEWIEMVAAIVVNSVLAVVSNAAYLIMRLFLFALKLKNVIEGGIAMGKCLQQP